MRVFVFALVACAATAASALPEGPRAFCADRPDSPLCAGRTVSCALCHTSAPDLNGYGGEVLGSLGGAGYDGSLESFLSLMPQALDAADASDADADGLASIAEIELGSFPGDPTSLYVDTLSGEGAWDPRFAFRRARVAFCGAPPLREELDAIPAVDGADARAAVRAAVADCLDSDYWKNEALHRLANKRVRPQASVGYDRGNTFSLGDYRYDYRLFSRSLSGGHDARDLLLASDHVNPDGTDRSGVFSVGGSGGNLGQPLDVDHRAGMITTTWFMAINTMFSPLPRTTAAQAYRSYLGQDIALSEGLRPVAGEPLDLDARGVAQEECARCHATLDPLSYSFAYYAGIAGPQTGTFLGRRVSNILLPAGAQSALLDVNLDNDPELAPADHGVRGWAKVAADSDEFARTLVFMLAEHALGREPTPEDTVELLPLLQSFRADGFSADAAVKDIVDTNAFGRP